MIETTMLGLAVLIVAILEAIKITDIVAKKLMPLVSIVVGAIIGLVYGWQFGDIQNSLFAGLISGLIACGLYDVVLKKVLNSVKNVLTVQD